jgi:hypothetical protein
MSDHFTLDFCCDLRGELTATERSTLEYLVRGGVAPPPVLPEHPYFERGLTEYPNWRAYKGFEPGQFNSTLWVRGGQPGAELLGLSLRLPSLKIEAMYEDALPYLTWLATLSESHGFAGHTFCEETRRLGSLLFIFERELYVDFEPKPAPISCVTGSKWTGPLDEGPQD